MLKKHTFHLELNIEKSEIIVQAVYIMSSGSLYYYNHKILNVSPELDVMLVNEEFIPEGRIQGGVFRVCWTWEDSRAADTGSAICCCIVKLLCF